MYSVYHQLRTNNNIHMTRINHKNTNIMKYQAIVSCSKPGSSIEIFVNDNHLNNLGTQDL